MADLEQELIDQICDFVDKNKLLSAGMIVKEIITTIKKENRKSFEAGIIYACALLIRTWGENTLADNILKEAGINLENSCADIEDLKILNEDKVE